MGNTSQVVATLHENLFNATDWDLDRFDFTLEFRVEATGAVFVRFTPKFDQTG